MMILTLLYRFLSNVEYVTQCLYKTLDFSQGSPYTVRDFGVTCGLKCRNWICKCWNSLDSTKYLDFHIEDDYRSVRM